MRRCPILPRSSSSSKERICRLHRLRDATYGDDVHRDHIPTTWDCSLFLKILNLLQQFLGLPLFPSMNVMFSLLPPFLNPLWSGVCAILLAGSSAFPFPPSPHRLVPHERGWGGGLNLCYFSLSHSTRLGILGADYRRFQRFNIWQDRTGCPDSFLHIVQ